MRALRVWRSCILRGAGRERARTKGGMPEPGGSGSCVLCLSAAVLYIRFSTFVVLGRLDCRPILMSAFDATFGGIDSFRIQIAVSGARKYSSSTTRDRPLCPAMRGRSEPALSPPTTRMPCRGDETHGDHGTIYRHHIPTAPSSEPLVWHRPSVSITLRNPTGSSLRPVPPASPRA